MMGTELTGFGIKSDLKWTDEVTDSRLKLQLNTGSTNSECDAPWLNVSYWATPWEPRLASLLWSRSSDCFRDGRMTEYLTSLQTLQMFFMLPLMEEDPFLLLIQAWYLTGNCLLSCWGQTSVVSPESTDPVGSPCRGFPQWSRFQESILEERNVCWESSSS